jgi:glycosyltransferase involved in cell wall biosynthesis
MAQACAAVKILLVFNSYQEPGGEDVVFRKEGHLLKEAGHEVSEYRRDNDEIKAYSSIRRLSLVGQPVWAWDSYRDFRALLRQNRPEIVHVHNTFPLISPSIFWACRKRGVPVVHTLHNYRLLCPQANFFRAGKPCQDCITGSYWQGAVHGCYRNSSFETVPVALMLTVHRECKTWIRMVDRYIAPSDFARDQFVKGGFPASQITVKPNFVDPDPGLRIGNGSYALFIGRVSPEKGIDTLLRTWRKLPKTYTLRILGEGPSRGRLKSEAKEGGLSNVDFMGWLPHDQAMEVVKGARFLIFPSELYETFGLGIVEAFACGVPVVVSRLGAMQEIVQEGHTGFLFRPGDTDDLARTVVHAWNEPELMHRLGVQARLEYETKYTAAVNYRQLIEIYQQVIAREAPMEESLGMRVRAEQVPHA